MFFAMANATFAAVLMFGAIAVGLFAGIAQFLEDTR